MSPEQARGGPPDLRSDLWSLGVVLFEMLTARKPFDGEYEPAVVYSILNEEPASVASTRADVPVALQQILRRALAKEPGFRYQSSSEFAADLNAFQSGAPVALRTRKAGVPGRRRWAIGGISATLAAALALVLSYHRGAEIDSIAVLPFADLSKDTTEAYFADGMTEELITRLGQVRALTVRPRSAVMRYKGSGMKSSEIANELGVKGLLVPAMLRSGDKIRVTSSLIDAKADKVIWSREYERSCGDVLLLQSEISQEIVRELRAHLLPQESQRLDRAYQLSPAAHEAYLKGMFLLGQGGLSGAEKAKELFSRTVDLDSNFAPAYLGIADCIKVLASDMTVPPEEGSPQWQWAVMQALRKDPDLAEAHVHLGNLKGFMNFEMDAAEREFRLAVDLNPGSVSARVAYGAFLAALGRYDDAIPQLQRSIDLDPLNPERRLYLAQVHFFYRHFDRALALINEVLEVVPEDPYAVSLLGLVYLVQGRYEDALKQFEKDAQLEPASVYTQWQFAWLYARWGVTEKAQESLNVLLRQRYFNRSLLASVYGELGQKDHAFALLDTACTRHETTLVNFLKAGPAFDALRSDQRFPALLAKVGLNR